MPPNFHLPSSLPVPSPQGVREFRELYFSHTGRHLSEAEAEDYARRYLLLFYLAVSQERTKDRTQEGSIQRMPVDRSASDPRPNSIDSESHP